MMLRLGAHNNLESSHPPDESREVVPRTHRVGVRLEGEGRLGGGRHLR